ncbi:hypothetical protein CALVIDRAFT_595746 [Calocera viscosa TUFC12733]|uniref:Uncharacterized protein n=1 Tax=Calocera viscosa (strain TUFC12733) TaxID=1330018 RepID=A0A167QCI6_CALVF|nr:hypothetical protein CALVIDRAFT_595746 [Calocera viscosa TUFC12733]
MPSLALTIFLLVLLTQVISWIGQSVLEEYAFNIYALLLLPTLARRQATLRKEVFADKQDLLRTSAQDEFAKWAKLRRKVDKGLADLEKLNGELSGAKSAFSLRFKTSLFILTSGAQWLLVWWYRKSPVFYLPPGWLGPLGWWLSLPFAPAGSVSCGMWQFACRRVIKLCSALVREIFAAVLARTAGMAMPTPVPVAVPEAAGEKGKAPPWQEKKTQ